jgi:hypothetical protein
VQRHTDDDQDCGDQDTESTAHGLFRAGIAPIIAARRRSRGEAPPEEARAHPIIRRWRGLARWARTSIGRKAPVR